MVIDPHMDLFIDLRERMVRIETKIDGIGDHDGRLTALEQASADTRSSVRTLRWVGGVILTGLTLFGDKMAHLFT